MPMINCPIDITPVLHPFCDGCKIADLSIETDDFYSFGDAYFRTYRLVCSKYEQCEMIAERLTKEIKYNDKI